VFDRWGRDGADVLVDVVETAIKTCVEDPVRWVAEE
jgi:hypothetical protein